jgi:ketosteroid isomerase-like protein
MQPEQRALIEWQLTQLNYASAYYMDNGEFEDMIELFTPDALFDRAGLVHHGHEEIRQAMRERPAMTTRHLLANLHYTDVTPDSAAGVVSAITYHGILAEDGEPVPYATRNGRVLDFCDTYVRTGDCWKIASRVARVVFTPEDWPGNLNLAARSR